MSPSQQPNKRFGEIEDALRATKGIRDVKWPDKVVLGKIAELENLQEAEGLAGMGGYCNQGVKDVLKRKYICVVLNDNTFRHASEPSLSWVAGGIVIGEEVTSAKQRKALEAKGTVKMLRKKFALHFDRMKAARGHKPVFIVHGLPFYEIEKIAGIQDVLSASPIGAADVHCKKQYGWDRRANDLGTILIGFNLS